MRMELSGSPSVEHIASRAASNLVGVRAMSVRNAPSLAHLFANANPMPLDPPVITTCFPLKDAKWSFDLLLICQTYNTPIKRIAPITKVVIRVLLTISTCLITQNILLIYNGEEINHNHNMICSYSSYVVFLYWFMNEPQRFRLNYVFLLGEEYQR